MASLVRRDPFADLTSFWQRDLERLFGSLAGSMGDVDDATSRPIQWIPPVDILTRGDDLVLRLELPGIDPDTDLEITVEDGVLRVRGERQETEEVEGEGFIRRETSYGTFERAVRLPREVKAEDLKASYEKGVLEIVAPNAAKKETQRVSVQVGSSKEGSGKQK